MLTTGSCIDQWNDVAVRSRARQQVEPVPEHVQKLRALNGVESTYGRAHASCWATHWKRARGGQVCWKKTVQCPFMPNQQLKAMVMRSLSP
jgi:hypothetical protein